MKTISISAVTTLTVIVVFVVLTFHSKYSGASISESEPGRYKLVASSHTGVSSIYRIDTMTGEVSLCYIDGDQSIGYSVTCTSEGRQ